MVAAKAVAPQGRRAAHAGRLLRSLFERRAVADYGTAPVPGHEAEQAIRDATAVVDQVEAWLSSRASS